LIKTLDKVKNYDIFYVVAMVNVKRQDWSPKKRSTAITLRNEGYSYRQIASNLGGGATPSAVCKLFKRFKETKNIKNKSGKGREMATTRQTDRRIVRMALQNRKLTAVDINKSISQTGILVSDRTVRNRLIKAGLRARIPRKKPFLNKLQRRRRLAWAREHEDWTVDMWKQVLWSDETRISVMGSDGIRYVRRRSGEDCLPECLTPKIKHPLSVMVWGCMARSGVGMLQVLDGHINADRYIEQVLKPKMVPSASIIFGEGQPFIFQQDGAPCHTAKKCTQWFARNKVVVMEWPGNSPDLNPIENLWARLKRAIAGQRPGNHTELMEAIVNSWYHIITNSDLEKLVDSMPRRCKAVIKSKGYPTRY